jgi:hypothetical protein
MMGDGLFAAGGIGLVERRHPRQLYLSLGLPWPSTGSRGVPSSRHHVMNACVCRWRIKKKMRERERERERDGIG